MEELQESRRLLQEKVAVVEAARNDLVANKQQLEEDISVKENSLTIDQVALGVSNGDSSSPIARRGWPLSAPTSLFRPSAVWSRASRQRGGGSECPPRFSPPN